MVESLRLSWRCAAGCLATSPTLLYNLMPILLAPISEAKEYTWHTIKRGFTEVFSNFLAWQKKNWWILKHIGMMSRFSLLGRKGLLFGRLYGELGKVFPGSLLFRQEHTLKIKDYLQFMCFRGFRFASWKKANKKLDHLVGLMCPECREFYQYGATVPIF